VAETYCSANPAPHTQPASLFAKVGVVGGMRRAAVVALLLLGLAPAALGFKAQEFKTCDMNPFCKRCGAHLPHRAGGGYLMLRVMDHPHGRCTRIASCKRVAKPNAVPWRPQPSGWPHLRSSLPERRLTAGRRDSGMLGDAETRWHGCCGWCGGGLRASEPQIANPSRRSGRVLSVQGRAMHP
jgi:hypothetical protein